MSYEQVAQMIFKEAKKAGYVVEERKSVSTNSIYYTIHSGKCSLMFRVSDHSTNSNVITLRIDIISILLFITPFKTFNAPSNGRNSHIIANTLPAISLGKYIPLVKHIN